MLKIGNGRLPRIHQDKLAEYQKDVDEKCSYPEQVKAAKTLFKSRNRKEPVAVPYFRNEEVPGDMHSEMTVAGPLFDPDSDRVRG